MLGGGDLYFQSSHRYCPPSFLFPHPLSLFSCSFPFKPSLCISQTHIHTHIHVILVPSFLPLSFHFSFLLFLFFLCFCLKIYVFGVVDQTKKMSLCFSCYIFICHSSLPFSTFNYHNPRSLLTLNNNLYIIIIQQQHFLFFFSLDILFSFISKGKKKEGFVCCPTLSSFVCIATSSTPEIMGGYTLHPLFSTTKKNK